jgi:hypothetical protein
MSKQELQEKINIMNALIDSKKAAVDAEIRMVGQANTFGQLNRAQRAVEKAQAELNGLYREQEALVEQYHAMK